MNSALIKEFTVAAFLFGSVTGPISMPPAAEAGYVKTGVEKSESGVKKGYDVTEGGTKKGVKEGVGGTKKGVKEGVGGTKKGVKEGVGGVKKGVKSTKQFFQKVF